MNPKTAFLIDAEFLFRRLHAVCGELPPDEAVSLLVQLCHKHLDFFTRTPAQLYRIFVYDCPPLGTNGQQPISKRNINWAKSDLYFWRTAVHKSLKKQRKVALRMGKLQVASPPWVLRSEKVKELLAGTIQVGDLKDEDFRPDIQQKGVDMKIGLDIASISNRRLADQIVLVTGDSDFVPAVKYARREGIDLVLDSLDAPVPEDLLEHVDGHQSVIRYLVPTRAPILRKPAASDER